MANQRVEGLEKRLIDYQPIKEEPEERELRKVRLKEFNFSLATVGIGIPLLLLLLFIY